MILREMEPSDLDAVVEVHKKAFAVFFLTRMGPSFLRAYYQAVLDFEASIALVAQEIESDRVLGFAVGFKNPQGFYALLRQRRKQMLPSVLLAMLRDPGLVPQIVRNMSRVEAQAQQPVNAAELSSIAVFEPGKGVGSELLEAFVDRARSQGLRRVILTTDAKENYSVHGFYEAHGFILEGTETRGARQLCCYFREF